MAIVAGISWLKAAPRTLPGMDGILSRVIKQQDWPFTVKFNKVHTRWEEWSSPLTLELQELTVADREGVYTLTMPHAIVKFRVMPLLRGKMRFRHVVLTEPTLEWKIEPSYKDPAETTATTTVESNYASEWKILQRNPVYLASLNALFKILEKPSLLPLRRLEAKNMTINLALPEETRSFKRDKLILRLKDEGEGTQLTLRSTEDIRGVPSAVEIQVMKDSADMLWAKLGVENFSTDWIGTASPELAWYGNLALFFTGEWNSFIHRSGRLEQADFGFQATPRSSLQFSLSGNMKNQPLFHEYSNIPDVELRFEFQSLPVDRIAAYWPLDIAADARSWVTQNLVKGTATSGTAEIKLPPAFWITGEIPVDGVLATIPFEHLEARLGPDLPSITNAKGVAEFTRDAMHLTVEDGNIKNSSIQSGATVVIPNLGSNVETLEITGKTIGPVADLLGFYSIQEKKLGRRVTFDEAKVKGEAVSSLNLHFPLLKELALADIDYTVQSEIADMAYPEIAPGISLSKGHFTLDYKDKAMQVEGVAALNEIESKITYATSDKEGRKTDATLDLMNTVEATQLPKLGFPEVPGATGPIDMQYHLDQLGDKKEISIVLNAKDATLHYPAIGFSKPAGETLRATLSLSGEGKAEPTLRNFHAEGDAIEAHGNSSFDEKGNLQEILFEKLRFNGNDGQLKISRSGEDKYVLQVAAQTLNLEPLIRYYGSSQQEDKKEEKDKTAFTLKGTSRTVLLANGEKITNVAGELTCLPEQCISANLSAKAGGNANLTLSLIPGPKESVFSANTENAGAVLRGLDIMKDIRGGMLTTRAVAENKTKDAPFTGNIIIKDFRIVGTPVLARLLSMMSLVGFVDTLNGKGIAFTKLDGRYTYGNHTYQLNDFKLYGSALGILLNGYANLKDATLKLSGTLIPAYGINAAIGKVPIVGNLLGKGVLATSFSVEGKTEDPKTEVYPLSTLAPGILGDFARDLGVLPSDKVKQPSPAPAQ